MSARIAVQRRVAKAKIRQTPRWIQLNSVLKSYYSGLADVFKHTDTSYDTATPLSFLFGRAFHGCATPRTWYRPPTRGKRGWR